MKPKVYIFDSHPVQYKAPVYQALQELMPDAFEVIYATDVSVRKGHIDKEFGKEVAWDTPLLSGYAYRVLHNERGVALSSPGSLSGRGVFNLLKAERPAAVLLTQARYRFDHAAYLSALMLSIPVLIRQETQDEMFAGQRHWFKQLLRTCAYWLMYAPVKHAFFFGHLNREHLLKHGVPEQRMSFAGFSVPDPIREWPDAQRVQARTQIRQRMTLREDQIVVGFFGKLIPKKHPELLYECLSHMDPAVRARLHFMVVGAGELQSSLDALAEQAKEKYGVQTTFTGFINQSQLPAYYLAADIVALPSRRMGEAWGLVINEALQAGCGVVMSDAVGCVAEFGKLDRVEVIPVADGKALAHSMGLLSALSRDFHWADDHMNNYSGAAAARALRTVFSAYLK